MIEIWSKPACPYCVKAKQLCEREGYDFPSEFDKNIGFNKN